MRRRRPATAGLTLIEVVAALALMATLLVAVLTIRSGLTRRRASADRRLRAVAAADGLLTTWWADPTTFPVDRSGPVPADPALGWSTRVLPNPPPLAWAAASSASASATPGPTCWTWT